jgi:sugar phosphate isomerase/epimerase
VSTITIGTAPDSWGVWFPSDPKQLPASQFLKEVAEADYGWIELGPYSYLSKDPAELKDQLDSHGLRALGRRRLPTGPRPISARAVERPSILGGSHE